MFNLLFISAGNILLFAVLLLLLIAYPVLMYRRNKKDQERQKQLVESLKVGEYVLTYSGVFGKITEIIEKEMGKFIVVETGEKHKNYITVSENAIYTIGNNNPKIYTADGEVKKPEIATENETEPEPATEETTKSKKK